MDFDIFSDEKVEQYKIILKRTYWELHEAAFFLSGTSSFGITYSLEGEMEKFLNIKDFGLIPLSWVEILNSMKVPSKENYNQVLKKIYNAIENEEVRAHSVKLEGVRRDSYISKKQSYLTNHTYFLSPDEAIAIAVTEGIQLPFELQVASGLYQTKKPTSAKKGGWKKETEREALAQIYWYLKPLGSIQGFVEEAFRLKMESRKRDSSFVKRIKVPRVLKSQKCGKFEFVHGNGLNSPKNRGRAVKKIKTSEGLVQSIPGLMEKKEQYLAFDYQNLRIVLRTIADYLCFRNAQLTSKELLQHPLIEIYSKEGGLPLDKTIKFSLKKTLAELDLSDRVSEF